MVFSAALLSTFLTNDVALFIVVPLTLTLRKLCEIPVTRLIIFEALAVNAGSLLTPIGPAEHSAVGTLRPVVYRIYRADGAVGAGDRGALLAAGLLSRINRCSPSGTTGPQWQPRLVWSCLGLYIVFLIALGYQGWCGGSMGIDVHLLIQLPVLQNVLHSVGGLSQPGLWLRRLALAGDQ
ncbi:hypothetical protein T636_A1493 [Enterobacter hormaechei subsp. xiangfangensis]|nr:hypothetical protein T636_A1493 [Enterobacter hormaechei subsp. xiangfangensis]